MTVSVKLTKSFQCLIAVTIIVLSSAVLPSFRTLSDLSDSGINRAVLNSGRARNNSDSDGGDEPSISSSSSTSQRTKLSVYYNVDVDDKKEKFGICKLCKEQKIRKIVKMKHSNTTGLKRHLKIAHRKEFDQLYGLTPQSKNQQLLHFSQVQASCSNISFTEKIVQWLAIKYLPFSFFDDTATQNFFAALNPNLKYPKRDTMKRRVLEIFEKKKDEVINILKNNESKISFTVDGWTSIAGKSYYGITAHFVDASWKLQSIVLDFVPSHTAPYIAATLQQHCHIAVTVKCCRYFAAMLPVKCCA